MPKTGAQVEQGLRSTGIARTQGAATGAWPSDVTVVEAQKTGEETTKAIDEKSYTRLRRIFVRLQGATTGA